MPQLPPWLIPSDPAPAALRGFTVGAQIGQHRAEQRFREAQMARQEQLAAMDQARWEAEIGMKAAEASRRHDAQMQYRQAIEGGMDPLDAMIRFGPEMGQQSSAEAAAIRAMYQKEKPVPSWEVRDLGQGARVLVSDQGQVMNLPGVPKEPAKWETETVTDLEGNPIQVQINTQTGERRSVPSLRQAGFMEQSFADRDELRELQRELRDLDKQVIESEALGMPYTHAMGKDAEDRSKAELRAIQIHDEQVRQREEIKGQITELRNKFRGKTTGTTTAPTGATAPTGKPRFIYDPASGQFNQAGAVPPVDAGEVESAVTDPSLPEKLRSYGAMGLPPEYLSQALSQIPPGALPTLQKYGGLGLPPQQIPLLADVLGRVITPEEPSYLSNLLSK